MYYILGLGNPGKEYELTRHNAGRIILDTFRKTHELSEWEFDKKSNSLLSEGTVGKEKVLLIEPETYMNKSGMGAAYFIKSQKGAEKLVVIYDDLDLPFGSMKISYNRGPGGHRGLESIINSLKTQSFVRIRIGISPVTPSGKIKKPHGEEAVEKIILGPFKKAELDVLKKLGKKVSDALMMIMTEGKEKAMGEFNQG
jgi:PTH1 family peptidyl-tRNA hydrolase